MKSIFEVNSVDAEIIAKNIKFEEIYIELLTKEIERYRIEFSRKYDLYTNIILDKSTYTEEEKMVVSILRKKFRFLLSLQDDMITKLESEKLISERYLKRIDNR